MSVLTNLFSIFMTVILALTSFFSGIESFFGRSDVVILYTGDVHCGVEENIGYSGLAAYKKEVSEKYKNVTLADCGDFVQGDLIGSVSSGEYIIDIMNFIGYDMAILGNHEFDYGMEQLNNLMNQSDFDYLGCDITYSGAEEDLLENLIDFEVIDYGNVQVGFVGVSTPYSVVTSTPANFKDEDGNFVYNFDEDIYSSVQKNALRARMLGADYVVVLSHLGDTDEYSPYSSTELIHNTVGIDAVLDGHAHHTVESCEVKNKKGEEVILSAAGTKLENIGQLVISENGELTASLISDYDKKDEQTDSFINGIKEKYNESLSKVVGSTDFTLSISDENGIRMIRNRETGIGDLCTDAVRTTMASDIAICNGGGIRADINKGDITNGDIIRVHPFSNEMCKIEATGQQIADALEWTSRLTEKEYTDGTNSVGENGGFLQVSGLKYSIDTSIPTSVAISEKGTFLGVTGERRVKDIMVLEGNTYVPIDLNKTYTVAGTSYVLTGNGDGQTAFDGCKVVSQEGLLDNELLMSYIKNTMNGKIDSRYSTAEGRITIY